MKKGFTLVELLAVIVILAIILAIAVPGISGLIADAKIGAFKSDAKMIIKSINLKELENQLVDVETLDETNVGNLLNIATENYETLRVNNKTDGIYISVVGKNKWEGYVACGNYKNITVQKGASCQAGGVVKRVISYGGTGSDSFFSVIEIPDGYIAVGQSNSSDGDLTELNNGDNDAIIVKYDSNGNVEWNKNFGGTGRESFEDVALAADGGYIVTGYSNSTGGYLTELNKGVDDAIIVKYDSNGNVEWNKNFGGTGYDWGEGILSVADGYVMAGYSTSNTIDLDGMNGGQEDGIIVKFDSTGNVVWKKNFGGIYRENFVGITKSNDGYIVSGFAQSPSIIGADRGNVDAIAVKYLSNGTVAWIKPVGGSDWEGFNKIASTATGQLAIVGSCASPDGDVISLDTYNGDAAVFKLDDDGNIIWGTCFGGSGYEDLYDVTYSNESIVVVGETDSTDRDLTGLNKGDVDVIVRKYSANNEVIWTTIVGGSDWERLYNITTTSQGYVAAGSSLSNDGDLMGLNKGSYDAIIVVME